MAGGRRPTRRQPLDQGLRRYPEGLVASSTSGDAMLGPDGQPREDLWVADRIHPNHDGYLIRVRVMRPLLGPPDKP